MTTTTRWLKWNAVYDLDGICNKPLADLASTTEQNLAIKQRLYLLGFDCGNLDNTLDEKTKKALRTFNGYFNHPAINRLIDPVTLPPTKPPALAPPFFDNDTIKCLYIMEDDLQPVLTSDIGLKAKAAVEIMVSKNRIGRAGYGTTLNQASPLAVRVVSTPKSIVPFDEYATIEIQIKGFEKVQSLLFRIYRNFDSAVDRISIAGGKLVYQEILDREGIEALILKGPKNNVGKHHPAKAFIMRQELVGGYGGAFKSSLGAAYEKLHVPYKIRVWVSSIPDFFKQYAFQPTTEMPSSRKSKTEQENLHYLDSDQREQVKRGREKVLTDEQRAKDTSYRNEPDINHMDVVHDLSIVACNDPSEFKGVLVKNWDKLIKWNSALNRGKYWTQGDQQTVNLIDEPCRVPHNARFMLDNIIKQEKFVDDFADKPVETYLDLREKMDRDGENFQFAGMAELFANIERHINIIKRRLCCGQWQQLAENFKNDVLSFIEKVVLPEIKQLKSDGFPYDKCVLFCEKFMSFFSFVVHHAVVYRELEFYRQYDLQKNSQVSMSDSIKFTPWLRDRRARIDGNRSPAGSEFGTNFGHSYNTKQGTSELAFVAKAMQNDYPQLKEEVLETQGVRRIGKPILIPSYNPLNPYFFVRTRAVPMYAIGMIDMQYLNADGIRQIPVGFFEHDLFHVCTPGTGTQLWKTLYARLCNVIDFYPQPHPEYLEALVYAKWQENIDIMTRKINAEANATRKRTLTFLIFWLLHEPHNNILPPAVPEPNIINARLTQGNDDVFTAIRGEDAIDFFGNYSHAYMQHLNWAKNECAALLTDLENAT